MEKSSNRKMIYSVALYRVLAMLIVLLYHLVEVPSWAPEVINVYKSQLSSPILSDTFLYRAELKISNFLNTNFGAFAVTMFFIASGYLVSKMMDRYSRKEFLVNRAISSFPTLWVCLIIMAIFVRQQGFIFSPVDFLASAFPFIPLPAGQFLSAVLWTLRVEMKFYILAAVLFYGKRKKFIFYGYAFVILCCLVNHEFTLWWLNIQLCDIIYFPFLFLGVLIEQEWRKCEQTGEPLRYEPIVLCVFLNLLLLKITEYLDLPRAWSKTYYASCMTQILPVVLLLLLLNLERKKPHIFERIPSLIYSIGKLVYPFYLLHASCGLTVMYQMALAGWSNPYAIIAGGVGVALAVSALVYLTVTMPSGRLMKRAVSALRERGQSGV